MLENVELREWLRQAIADLVGTTSLRSLEKKVGHSHEWIYRRTSGKVEMKLDEAALIAHAVTGGDGDQWVADVICQFQSTPGQKDYDIEVIYDGDPHNRTDQRNGSVLDDQPRSPE